MKKPVAALHELSLSCPRGCLQVKDAQHDLIDPAVNGTKNVLASVLKSKDSVRRVILTSSISCEF